MDSGLNNKRAEYNRKLEKALEKITNRLSAIPGVVRVILIGSYASGRRDLFTDLDLIVIMHTDQDFIQRTAELYQQLEVDVDLDLLVYTPREFEEMRETGFIARALETGKVIYEKQPA